MVGIAQYQDRDPGRAVNTGFPHNPNSDIYIYATMKKIFVSMKKLF